MASLNRVRTVFSGVAGAPYYSNMYFVDDMTLTAAQDAINAVNTFWTGYSGNMTTSLTWTVEGNVARIDSVSGALTGQWAGTPATGAGATAGELLPRVAQGLVQWLTNHVTAGRMLRGRTFVPGLLETLNTTGGVPSAALVTLHGTLGNALIADAGNTLVVWSRTHGDYDPAVTAQGWNQWAALRSRRD